MLELLFVLGFFLMLMVTGAPCRVFWPRWSWRPPSCSGRDVSTDDQAVTVATAGGGCGVGDQSSKNAKNPKVSA
ncbi:Uncharacterised protein [Salmonella enterica subsp. arizonae]|uniref:Uncharacterized protein n=1 Tax=Salmonella enterica subsp. arizonae TaxID=59203 RepID=A0A2X4TYL4_SALER|nr:Uncharacterised protein [Salmonella enterica subsp. arizonae]